MVQFAKALASKPIDLSLAFRIPMVKGQNQFPYSNHGTYTLTYTHKGLSGGGKPHKSWLLWPTSGFPTLGNRYEDPKGSLTNLVKISCRFSEGPCFKRLDGDR